MAAKLKAKRSDDKILSQLVLLMPFAAAPIPAYAANVAGYLSLYYIFYVIPIILLIHFIAMIYFQKRDRYRSKAFMGRHLLIVMLLLLLGLVITTFEYLINITHTGMHIGTFLSILFVYGFIALLFAIPYLLYSFTTEK